MSHTTYFLAVMVWPGWLIVYAIAYRNGYWKGFRAAQNDESSK